MQRVFVRRLERGEYEKAMELAWRVYQEFEAPDYSSDGIAAYYASIHTPSYWEQLCVYGAFENHELVGILATRDQGRHIAMFSVDGAHHRQGIGKQLFRAALCRCPGRTMTVRSSPYAVEVYRHLGFRPTGREKSENGIRYTPMRCRMRIFPVLRIR